MSSAVSQCLFAAELLNRASDERTRPDWIAAKLKDPESRLVPVYWGDPLVADGTLVVLKATAREEFARNAAIVFLGLMGERAYFAIDASDAPSPESAPFADVGAYTPLREAASHLQEGDLAIVGQARWLLDWHRRHRFCAVCGAPTEVKDGGAKRQCPDCQAEHFPRSDPVAIVLAIHEGACLLGRNTRFPPGFFSALAGYVEACETPEACAVREIKEEAGVTLTAVHYQFSQPWPFPSSMMMGFLADAKDRTLKLDETEICEAKWVDKAEIRAILGGEKRENFFLPPRFTIARRLIERWAGAPA